MVGFLYVVAYATALCVNLGPCNIKFDNSNHLRTHLFSLLENKNTSMFPHKITNKIRKPFKHSILLYTVIINIEMIECSKSQEWFHTQMCDHFTQSSLL